MNGKIFKKDCHGHGHCYDENCNIKMKQITKGYKGSKNNKTIDDSPENIKKILINVKRMYIGGIILWTIIFFGGRMFKSSYLAMLPLLIPYFTFGINYFNIDENDILNIRHNSESKSDVLSYIFVTSAVLSNWGTPAQKNKASKKTMGWVLFSIVLLVLSMIDITTNKNILIYEIVMEKIFHTIGLTILTYVVIDFYIDIN